MKGGNFVCDALGTIRTLNSSPRLSPRSLPRRRKEKLLSLALTEVRFILKSRSAYRRVVGTPSGNLMPGKGAVRMRRIGISPQGCTEPRRPLASSGIWCPKYARKHTPCSQAIKEDLNLLHHRKSARKYVPTSHWRP
jgi:hypothetical protein